MAIPTCFVNRVYHFREYGLMGFVGKVIFLHNFINLQSSHKLSTWQDYASSIKSCGVKRSLADGKYFHANFISHGNSRDRLFGNLLIEMYGKCGALQNACTVYNALNQPNVFSRNIMIAVHMRCGNLEGAKMIFNSMSHRNVVSWTTMLVAYVHYGCLVEAQVLFDEMPQKDAVSWSTIIIAYARNGSYHQALQLLEQMTLNGLAPEKSTLITILDLCCNAEAIVQGKKVHEFIKKHNLNLDVELGNSLITLYGKGGQIQSAELLFYQMDIRDVVSWTALIQSYKLCGYYDEAFQHFQQMQLTGPQPNKITYMTVMDVCTWLGSLAKGKWIHVHIVCNGFGSDLCVGSLLIYMYGKHGALQNAIAIFKSLPQHDVVSWTSLISAYSQNGYKADAISLFHWFQQGGILPSKVTYMTILDACSGLQNLAEGKQIHESITSDGLGADIFVGAALINMYSRCGNLKCAEMVFKKMNQHNIISLTAMVRTYAIFGCLEEARILFKNMPQHDMTSWNVMLGSYVEQRQTHNALQLFQEMLTEGIVPTEPTYMVMLDACSDTAILPKGKHIHGSIVRNSCDLDVTICNKIISMYGRCGAHKDAQAVFNKMPKHDHASLTTLLAVYKHNGHGHVAIHLFLTSNLVKDFIPDIYIYATVVDACADIASLSEGKLIHGQIIQTGFQTDIAVANALINMYGKCSCLKEAVEIFEVMPHYDMVSKTATLAAYAGNGHGKEALELFQQMQFGDIRLDSVPYMIAIDACTSMANLVEGNKLYNFIVDKGLESNSLIANGLLNMYAKSGSLEGAESIFAKMHRRDTASWNAILEAWIHSSKGSKALDILGEMHLEGVEPNKVTFMRVLFACNHMGLLSEGCHHFVSMSEHNDMIQTLEHHHCIVNLLGRAGNLEEAENWIQSMAPTPASISWMSLLGACHIYADREMGMRAARCLLDLNSDNAVSYVLLANIYAADEGLSGCLEYFDKDWVE